MSKWPGDEAKVLSLISDRLELGLNQYGPLDVHDSRNKPQEALEEALDLAVYVATELIAEAEHAEARAEVFTEAQLRNQILDREYHVNALTDELVAERKKNAELRAKIDEMIDSHGAKYFDEEPTA